MNQYNQLPENSIQELKALKGPIVIFGAGGFIGINLLKSILLYRDDVIGVTQDYLNNWRFIANEIPLNNLRSCDINQTHQLRDLVNELKPQTIFNLAAYGAYSKQKQYSKIYRTNFVSSIDLIETLKSAGFSAYIHAGSSSEYGLNASAPKEEEELLPNSHYAVSKAAFYQAAHYYGKVEHLPLVHLRLYSAYGPWEETDRLIPVLLAYARNKRFPSLVNPEITRDFIYINDVIQAFIKAATHADGDIKGEALNIGTGKKTSIKELAFAVKELEGISATPQFGNMENRAWDLDDWYANPQKAKDEINFSASTNLLDGLKKVLAWQRAVDYDNAFWNRNKI